jgi:tRNA nucleotidyltransferase/poly(A) polymerase
VDAATLRWALAPHGKVEELLVAHKPVGMRLYPRDRIVRGLAPAGIEFAPPRREVSTGPGRHDFEIVVDPGAGVTDDLARRDFTINAMARRVGTATSSTCPAVARPEQRVLRTVSARSFAGRPDRVRGLRFVSQLALEPDDATLAQMQRRRAVALVSV